MNKIPFYKERKFGEKFDAVFSFMKQNWRYMIKYVLYGALPLSLVAALSMDKLFSNALEMETAQTDIPGAMFFVNYGFLVLVSILAVLWIGSLMFSYIQLYNERENGLESSTFEDVIPYLKRNAWRMVKCSLVLMLLALVVLGVVVGGFVINVWGLSLLLIVLALIIFIPVLMFMPTYIFEDIPVWRALTRGIWLGWNTWGGIFALGFVLSLIANVVSMVFVMPWEICIIAKTIFGTEAMANPVANSVLFSLVQYVFGVIMWVGQLVVSTLYFVSISYLYSHAAEKLDDMSVAKGIDDFEEMSDDGQDDDDLFKTPEI